MKKLVKSVLMLSIASLAILSSCKKDDDNADVTDVKVEISSDPASPVIEGMPVKIKVVATGNTENKLKSISLIRSQAGSADVTLLSKSLTGTSATEEVIDSPMTGNYTYTVAVTGEKGSPATKTLTLNTIPAPGTLNVSANAIPLFAHQNGAGSNANFMNLSSSFSAYTTGDFEANKANIDMAFYFGQTNKASLTSPTDGPMQSLFGGLTWTGVNTTSLYKTSMTVAEFDAIVASNSDEEITTLASTVTTWVSAVNQLAVNNILLFKTQGGKLGLVKVESIVGTNATDGEIGVKVVVQD